jgi:PilZ domain
MGRVRKRRTRQPFADVERRASTRYPVVLEIQYTTLGDTGPVRLGTGTIIDLSSSGLSFSTDTPLLIGQRIKAYIDWPVMLNGNVKLQLEILGVVVRTAGTKIAVQIERHDFRTRSVRRRSA